MHFRKKLLSTILVVLTFAFAITSFIPFQAYAETEHLYLGGFPAGFTLNTKTVEVIGLCDVLTAEGMCCPARESGIKCGDIIDKINDVEVDSSSKINKILAEDYKQYNVQIIRSGEIINIDINPAKDMSSGTKRLGILVKDSISGIGTVTYIDKSKKTFASLGHPVTDLKGNLIEINSGTIYGCLIYDIKKAVKNAPGELKGAFENYNVLGEAKLNCPYGIYGNLNEDYDVNALITVQKGSINNAKIGKACIYTTIYGNEVKKYNISIVKCDKENKDNRNYVIKIDDKHLIEKSGGIVQGMSGSPIVQNGKLIGAITHVFVNDPTRGYGISIDKMLQAY